MLFKHLLILFKNKPKLLNIQILQHATKVQNILIKIVYQTLQEIKTSTKLNFQK